MVSARFIAKCLRVIDLWMWPLRGAQHSLLLWCTSLTRRDLRPCTLNNVAFLRVLLIKPSPTKGFVVSFDNYSLSLFHSSKPDIWRCVMKAGEIWMSVFVRLIPALTLTDEHIILRELFPGTDTLLFADWAVELLSEPTTITVYRGLHFTKFYECVLV